MWLKLVFFLGLATVMEAAPKKYFVACDVTLRKNLDPVADCEKLIFRKKQTDQQIATMHDKRFRSYKRQFEGFRCFRENEKDRIQKQIFTFCHNKDKSRYQVFLTSEPRDTRAVLYFQGIKTKWFEADVGVFLYKRYLMPKPSWKQWLLPN